MKTRCREVWPSGGVPRGAPLSCSRRVLRRLRPGGWSQASAALPAPCVVAHLRVRREGVASARAVIAVRPVAPGSAEASASIVGITDVGCWIGQPSATVPCDDLVDFLIVNEKPGVLMCAEALRAVAVYRWPDCCPARDDMDCHTPESRRLDAEALVVVVGHGPVMIGIGCRCGDTGNHTLRAPVPVRQLHRAGGAWPQLLNCWLRRGSGAHGGPPITRRASSAAGGDGRRS